MLLSEFILCLGRWHIGPGPGSQMSGATRGSRVGPRQSETVLFKILCILLFHVSCTVPSTCVSSGGVSRRSLRCGLRLAAGGFLCFLFLGLFHRPACRQEVLGVRRYAVDSLAAGGMSRSRLISRDKLCLILSMTAAETVRPGLLRSKHVDRPYFPDNSRTYVTIPFQLTSDNDRGLS